MGKLRNGIVKDVDIQIKRKTSAQWTFQNPVLADGEPGYELDTKKLKFGDGVNPWVSLPYFGGAGGSGTVTSVDASISGALSVSGGPITTSGTLAFTWTGASSDVVLGDGSLLARSSLLAGYVPYTGANATVDLNTQKIIAGTGLFGPDAGLNQRGVRISEDSAFVDIGSLAGVPTFAALYFNQATPSSSNYTMTGDGDDLLMNTNYSWQMRFVNSPQFIVVNQNLGNTSQDFLGLIPASYSPSVLAEHRTMHINTRTRTWPSGGTLARNRENLFEGMTLAAAAGLTITDAYGLYVQKSVVGSNVTITNNYAIGVNGPLQIQDGTEAAGYVLTSDASGGTSWQPTASVTPSLTSTYVGVGDSSNLLTGSSQLTWTNSGNPNLSLLTLTGGTAPQFYMNAPGVGNVLLEIASTDFYVTGGVSSKFVFRPANGTETFRLTGTGAGVYGVATPTAWLDVAASTALGSHLRLRDGVSNATIATPASGMINQDGTNLWAYLGSAWQRLNGIYRVIFTGQSGSVSAGSAVNTDYVYIFNASGTLTLPTAVSNTNAYTVKNSGAVNITVNFTGGETADGSASITVLPLASYTFISDNTNYTIN